MNDNEDIKKQLEVKNKEIYMNKLNLDLDNNLEVLVLTIDNLLNLLKSEALQKILEIEESFLNKQEIKESIEKFIHSYRENMMSLLDDKKVKLQNIIVIQDDLEICKSNLNDNYANLKNILLTSSKPYIKTLKDELTFCMDSSFKKKRLDDYLNNIFLVNLNHKVLDIIKNRDVILINTFHETYLKYLELNKNTVGVN